MVLTVKPMHFPRAQTVSFSASATPLPSSWSNLLKRRNVQFVYLEILLLVTPNSDELTEEKLQ